MRTTLTPRIGLPKTQLRTIQKAIFRELESIDHWSGYVKIINTSKEEFEKVLLKLSKDLGIRISGWILNNKNDDGFTYFMCRHQRKKYGPLPPVEKYLEALKELVKRTHSQFEEESYKDKKGFRTLIGLRKGYAENSGEFSLDDIKRELNYDNSFTLQETTILAVKPSGEKYTENAVLISGNLSKIDKIYDMADKLLQERFTVEDFSNKTNPKTYTVETKHCTEPEQI